NDVVGRVIRAGRLALAAVIFEIGAPFCDDALLAFSSLALGFAEFLERPIEFTVLLFDDRELFARHPKPELEEPYVNRTELANAKRFEIDCNELEAFRVFVACEQVERRR